MIILEISNPIKFFEKHDYKTHTQETLDAN